jgi:hypothetical protein
MSPSLLGNFPGLEQEAVILLKQLLRELGWIISFQLLAKAADILAYVLS